MLIKKNLQEICISYYKIFRMNYILLLLVSLIVGDSIDGDDRKGMDLFYSYAGFLSIPYAAYGMLLENPLILFISNEVN